MSVGKILKTFLAQIAKKRDIFYLTFVRNQHMTFLHQYMTLEGIILI